MSLYELEPSDVVNLRLLIESETLTITANHATRLALLQQKLANLEPSTALEVATKQGDELMRARDAALLEVGLLKAKLVSLQPATTKVDSTCNCGHAYALHDVASGCNDPACLCTSSTGEP